MTTIADTLEITARGRLAAAAAEFRAARLILGERMFKAGLDDGETGGEISRVDSMIARARDAGVEPHGLLTERDRLFGVLADAALEDLAPLPGADAEFARAWALKAELAGLAG